MEGQSWDHRSPPLGVAGRPGVPEEADVWTSVWGRATFDHTLVGVHVGDGNAPSALVMTSTLSASSEPAGVRTPKH